MFWPSERTSDHHFELNSRMQSSRSRPQDFSIKKRTFGDHWRGHTPKYKCERYNCCSSLLHSTILHFSCHNTLFQAPKTLHKTGEPIPTSKTERTMKIIHVPSHQVTTYSVLSQTQHSAVTGVVTVALHATWKPKKELLKTCSSEPTAQNQNQRA